DGIRVRNVTGVQTCALPISCMSRNMTVTRLEFWATILLYSNRLMMYASATSCSASSAAVCQRKGVLKGNNSSIISLTNLRRKNRSEERRVGKESKGEGASTA